MLLALVPMVHEESIHMHACKHGKWRRCGEKLI